MLFFLWCSYPVKMIEWDQNTESPALPQQMICPLLADLGQKEINISPLKSIRGELGQWLSQATLSNHCNIKPDTCSTWVINIQWFSDNLWSPLKQWWMSPGVVITVVTPFKRCAGNITPRFSTKDYFIEFSRSCTWGVRKVGFSGLTCAYS